jgi:phenylacetyl-CoA:acceptor oxidoreductase subunit 2
LHQQSWDARAAADFVAGGAGDGLVVFAALAGGSRWTFLLGAALVALGIASVALEIGRPLRALHVYRNPHTSRMSGEAIVALLLFGCVAAARPGVPLAGGAAGLAALAFVYCQGRMLQPPAGLPRTAAGNLLRWQPAAHLPACA